MAGELSADPSAPPNTHAPRRTSRVWWIVGAASLLIALGGAAVVFVPAFVTGLTSTVAVGDRVMRLTTDDAEATFTLPDGWSWRPHFGDEAGGVASSPDRVMTVDMEVVIDEDPLEALERRSPGSLGPVSEEFRSAGTGTFLHARVQKHDVVVGAVTDRDIVLTFVAGPSPEYDAELAGLLASVEVSK